MHLIRAENRHTKQSGVKKFEVNTYLSDYHDDDSLTLGSFDGDDIEQVKCHEQRESLGIGNNDSTNLKSQLHTPSIGSEQAYQEP